MGSLTHCIRTTSISKDDLAEIRAYIDVANGNEKAGIQKYMAALNADMADVRKQLKAQGQDVGVKREYQQPRRGSIEFGTDGKSVINLFEKANLSTFLHESGHFFLETLKQMAAGPEAPADIQAMLGTVKAWWLENSGDVARESKASKADVETYLNEGTTKDAAKDTAIDAALHEQFARATEAYFMEGKAPTFDLRAAFDRFRSWLIALYKNIAGLNVNVTPEIKSVLDRMLATDHELELAAHGASLDMMIPQGSALSDDEYKALRDMHNAAKDAAQARLLRKTMEPLKREQEQWFKDARKDMRVEVEKHLNSTPMYRAYEWLANGRWLGEGETAPMPDARLDRAELVRQYGEGVLKTLPRGKRAVYADGGMYPDEAAGWLGFESGEQLVKTLEKVTDRKRAIEDETDRAMREKYGDVLRDGEVEQAAMDAVHNDSQGQYLVAELKALKRLVGDVSQTMSAQQAREVARLTIAKMPVRDATQSQRFLSAERRAADQLRQQSVNLARSKGSAQRAVRDVKASPSPDAANSNISTANERIDRSNNQEVTVIQLAERRLMNHMLYSESMKVSEEVAKAERYVQKTVKAVRAARSDINKSPLAGDYIEAIEEVLDQYSFRRMTGAEERRQGRVKAFIDRMIADGRGAEIAIPPDVIERAQQVPYRTLEVNQFRGVIDTLKNIDNAARMKRKLLDAEGERDLDAVTTAIDQSITENIGKRDVIRSRSVRNSEKGIKEKVTSYFNIVRTADTILKELDGFKELGPLYRNLKSAIDAGNSDLAVMRHEAAKAMEEIYSVYSKDEQRAMSDAREVPELLRPGFDARYSKWDFISIALNMGNEDNIQRLTDRRVRGSFTPQQLDFVKAALDERDWKFVQSVWDYIDSYWPKIEERDKRLTGLVPEKIMAKPVETAHGMMRGGYYPLKYDGEVQGQSVNEETEGLESVLASGRYSKAQTRNGHLQARSTSSGRPVTIDSSVWHQHIQQVMHDLALHEPVTNSWKVLRDKKVEQAFIDSGRRSDYDTLKVWLLDVASGEMRSMDTVQRFARKARSAFSFSRMAFNLKTVLMQPLGIPQSMVVVGPRNFLGGVDDMLRMGFGAAEQHAMALSPFMRERQSTFNKDIYDFSGVNYAVGKAGKVNEFLDKMKPYAFWLMVKSQWYTADLPTWYGGYRKAIGEGFSEKDAIHLADRYVARSQGSGIFSDRSAVERGTTSETTRQQDTVRLFTALGSYMFAKFNIAYERTRETSFRDPRAIVAWTTDMAMLYVMEGLITTLGAVGYGLATGTGSGDDDPEKFAKDLAAQTSLSVLGSMPFVRDFASSVQGFSGGGAYQGFIEEFSAPVAQLRQGELDKAFFKAFISAAGVTGQFPSVQVNRTLDAIWEQVDGKDVSPIEFLRNASIGKPQR